jgi:hypothetical protein
MLMQLEKMIWKRLENKSKGYKECRDELIVWVLEEPQFMSRRGPIYE